MRDHLEADGSFINSIVGEGTRFEGMLELSGLLRIDGDFSGNIRTSGKVLVGKNGRAEWNGLNGSGAPVANGLYVIRMERDGRGTGSPVRIGIK